MWDVITNLFPNFKNSLTSKLRVDVITHIQYPKPYAGLANLCL